MSKPEYPEAARIAGAEGLVRLRVALDSAGKVVKVDVARSAGHGLDEAAVAAMKAWRFAPARECGQPVGTSVNIVMRFVLA